MNRIQRWLWEKAWDRHELTNGQPDFVIGRMNNPQVYRWYVIPRNKFCNIYLHCFLRSDQDFALHSHPWWFNLSWVLPMGEQNKYCELYPDPGIKSLMGLRWACQQPATRVLAQGAVRFRWGRSFHRVELFPGRSGEQEVWTIFITGPRWPMWIYNWGFMCPKGFVEFDKIVKYRTDKGSEPKDGCP